MKINLKVVIALLCFVLIGLGGVGYVFLVIQGQGSEPLSAPATEQPPIERIAKKNVDFARGTAAFAARNYTEAIKFFESALDQSKDPAERAQISYKMAQAYEEEGSSTSSIKAVLLYKAVAADERAGERLRAYAIQSIGNLLYKVNTPEIYAEVFSGDPYAGFLENGDYGLAKRKLFEYASTFRKLGISELRIAKWYTDEILKITRAGQAKERAAEIEEMKQRVREHLWNADRYLETIENDRDERWYAAEVLYRRAMVLGDLALSGDSSLGDPEAVFQRAIVRAMSTGVNEAPAKFVYASYLARAYGPGRASDIQKLLADFRIDGPFMHTGMVRSLKEERNNVSGYRTDVLMLARLDKNFAAFLRDIGWEL